MGVNTKEFDSFEQQFLELIGEFQTLTTSETRLRDALRTESNRAETAEAAKAAAERAAGEARAGTAAATAAATHAATALAKAYDEITGLRMQIELNGRQRSLLEERCSDLSLKLSSCERELEQLRPLQASNAILQRQYQELLERTRAVAEEARTEASKLDEELRRVEHCAGGGAELRERARLAAAAHARERRLAASELQHNSKELFNANAEVARLNTVISELQRSLAEVEANKGESKSTFSYEEALAEARLALEEERKGAARLERALASALADNAELASKLRPNDAEDVPPAPVTEGLAQDTKIEALESFLAD